MTNKSNAKFYIVGAAAGLVILGVILLPSMFDSPEPEPPPVGDTAPLSEPPVVDLVALQKEGFELLDQEASTGLGGTSLARLNKILVELPKLRELWEEQRKRKVGINDDIGNGNAAGSSTDRKEALRRQVEDAWTAYSRNYDADRHVPTSLLLQLRAKQLGEVLDLTNHQLIGDGPRYFGALFAYEPWTKETAKSYDWIGKHFPADAHEKLRRWKNVVAAYEAAKPWMQAEWTHYVETGDCIYADDSPYYTSQSVWDKELTVIREHLASEPPNAKQIFEAAVISAWTQYTAKWDAASKDDRRSLVHPEYLKGIRITQLGDFIGQEDDIPGPALEHFGAWAAYPPNGRPDDFDWIGYFKDGTPDELKQRAKNARDAYLESLPWMKAEWAYYVSTGRTQVMYVSQGLGTDYAAEGKSIAPFVAKPLLEFVAE